MNKSINRKGNIELTAEFKKKLEKIFIERVNFSNSVRIQHGCSEGHFEAKMPDAVVFPKTTEEVVSLVKLCIAYNIPIIPYGAGTSLEGHIIPVYGGITLSLVHMNNILSVNAEDLDCTVQAGVTREQLNTDLRDLGLFFPIDPGANATIGGMAATRASGTNAVRYGTMKNVVISLKVVMPDGKIIKTAQRARKSAAGYDLTSLLIGSEGTLGVITEITLRLSGIPERISSAVCSFESLDGAVDTVVQSMQLGIPLARVELVDEVQMNAINRWSNLSYPEKPTLFFEFHGSTNSVQEQVDEVNEISITNGGGEFCWSHLPEERSKLWKARHQSWFAALNLRPGSIGWATDVCVPISQLTECIRATRLDLDKATMPTPIVGHVGDGNFHVVFVLDPNSEEEAQEALYLNDRLIERALKMGGTCTGEHGIGLGKQNWLKVELGHSVDIMRLIKSSLDPQNLFNPGKIFSFSEPQY